MHSYTNNIHSAPSQSHLPHMSHQRDHILHGPLAGHTQGLSPTQVSTPPNLAVVLPSLGTLRVGRSRLEGSTEGPDMVGLLDRRQSGAPQACKMRLVEFTGRQILQESSTRSLRQRLLLGESCSALPVRQPCLLAACFLYLRLQMSSKVVPNILGCQDGGLPVPDLVSCSCCCKALNQVQCACQSCLMCAYGYIQCSTHHLLNA